jgi:hypothetical protein
LAISELILKGFDGAFCGTVNNFGGIRVALGAHPIGHAVPFSNRRGLDLLAVVALALGAKETDETDPQHYAENDIKHLTF